MRVSVSGHQGHQSITQLIAEAKKHSSQPKVQGGKPTGHPLEQELDQLYISRKSSGNQRLTFNDKLNKFIGLYNEKGSIIVKKEPCSVSKKFNFNFLFQKANEADPH